MERDNLSEIHKIQIIKIIKYTVYHQRTQSAH